MPHVIGRRAGETYPEAPRGGSSDGAAPPFSTAFWVDPLTNASDRNGSIGAPFSSLQEAFDTLGLGGTAIGSISFLVTPGTNAGSLVIPAETNGFLSIVGLNSSNRFTGAFSIIGAVTADAGADIGLGLENLTSSSGVVLPSGASNLEVTDSEIDGNISVGSNVYATNSILSGNITATSLAHFQICQFGGSRTITSVEIDVDATSNYYVLTQGVTVVGSKVVIADLTP